MKNEKKLNVLLYNCSTLKDSLIRNFLKSDLLGNIYLLNSEEPPKDKVIPIGYGKKIKLGEHKQFLKDFNIDFAIINNEIYLLNGVANFYKKINLPVVGTTTEWFLLEASKNYCKKFMLKNAIKTPEYTKVYDEKQLTQCIEEYGLPLVIKNDNLRAGFGTYICYTKEECIKKFQSILKEYQNVDNPFCLVEKFIKGKEISQHYAWDGNTLLPLLPVTDFKPFTGDTKVINTGGMGSFAPSVLNEKQQKLLDKYNKNLENIFKKLNPDFTSVFLVDLLFTEDEIYTLEFNMRPGLTEFETLIELFDIDLLSFYYNLANHQLDKFIIKYKKDLFSGCIAVFDKNYVNQKLKIIKLPLKAILPECCTNKLLINNGFNEEKKGGDVILNENLKFYSVINVDKNNPFNEIYDYLKDVEYPNIYYRKDIGSIFEKYLKDNN